MLKRMGEAARPLIRSLPTALRFAPRMWRWELVSRFAADLGVTAVAVQTADGLILSKGGTYLDIGANIGVTSLALASEKAITIHAFEPDPINFQMLTANLAINCPQHTVSLHQIELSDQNGTLAFEVNPTNAGDNRLAGSGHPAMGENRWKRIDVQARRLDALVGAIF